METLPVVYHDLNKDLIAKAERELKENEKNLELGLKVLRKLIEKESISCPTDDAFLTMFLRSKKYEVPRSFQQLKIYCKYKYLDYLQNEYPSMEKIKMVLADTVCGLLPRRDSEGRVVLYFRTSKYNTRRYDAEDVIGTLKLLYQFVIQYPATQINGICYIFEGGFPRLESTQFGIKYMLQLSPQICAFPARFKRIDCINCNIVCRAIVSLVKPFMSSKVIKRMLTLGDEKEALPKIYPASILPEEFGGTLGPLKDIKLDWIDDLAAFIDKFKADKSSFIPKK